jgi:hypothetical protein
VTTTATTATTSTVPLRVAGPPVTGATHRSWRSWLTLVLTAAGGTLLIAVSFALSAVDSTDTRHYPVFWLGLLLFFVPAVVVITSAGARPAVRHLWLLGYGLVSYVPKLLRDPAQPLFHDEIAHLRQTTDLLGSGQLFAPNYLIGIIARFPGLHILAATVTRCTGLSAWQTALLLMALAHVLALFGAALLGEGLLGSVRAGAVVALLYSLNSSFMFFDTEFGYESLAMPLFLLCLGCLAMAHRSAARRAGLPHLDDGAAAEGGPGPPVAGWTVAAIVVGAATAAIHHLTALVLTGLLAFVAVVTVLAAARGGVDRATARAAVAVAVAVGSATGSWLILVAPQTADYLSPYLGGSMGQLLHVLGSGGGRRTLFGTSNAPGYEHLSAFSVPVLAGVLTLIATAGRRRLPWPVRAAQPMRRALGLFGMLYFASVPFILVQFGAEGARRTWGFSYLGLAITLAPLVLLARDRLSGRRGHGRLAAAVAALGLACDALVGNVAAGVDESYRFPGPFAFGSDARSFTPELEAMSAWFRADLGPGVRVVSDRYTGLGLVRDADAHPAAPSVTFPTYQLWFDPGPPSSYLVDELETSGYGYLVIDKRMAFQLPQVGVYFEPDEPLAPGGPDPIAAANLARYRDLPWTTAVYDSDAYVIYRFDFAAYHRLNPR